MRPFRFRITFLLLALALGTLSRAGEHTIEGYWILPHGSGGGTLISVGGEQYRAKRVRLKDLVEACRIISQNNFNTHYWINVTPAPSPQEEFHGLILEGSDFSIASSGYGATNEMINSISFYADPRVATQVADAFNVTLEKREHPDHKLQTRFIWNEKEGNTNAVLEITNVGDTTVIFQDGGMNRGARNNQFSFVGFRNNKSLPDIGSPIHFGGISVYATLKKNEKFEKSVDLSKWFDLSEKGYYDIVGTYYLEFHSSVHDHRIIWADYVSSRFTFSKR